MANERDITHQGKWFEQLYEVQKQTTEDINKELAKKGILLHLFRDANLFQSVISKITNKSTEWENMDFLEENGEISIIYKRWEIPIVATDEEGLESLTAIIMPYITYNILYETPEPNDIDFYNDQYNLKQTNFFEIKENTLYLKISVYIKKYFASKTLFIPRIKLLIDFKNPFISLR